MALVNQPNGTSGKHRVIEQNEHQALIESTALGGERDPSVTNLYELAYFVKKLHAETANVIVTFFCPPVMPKGLKEKAKHIIQEVITPISKSRKINIDIIYALDPSHLQNIHELGDQQDL